MKRSIIITGPTATGKSALAVQTAQLLGGEIISADSMQIYKGMDIGTAKVTTEEMQGIPHYMIDIVSPTQSFAVGAYRDMALACAEDISSRGAVPIFVGGTGLYLNSVLFEMSFYTYNPEIKQEVAKLAASHTKEEMWQLLYSLNPDRAQELAVNDLKRVCRALEIAKAPHATVCTDELSKRRLDADIYVLQGDRAELYERINNRVDQMLSNGLIREVKTLVEMGCTADCQSFAAIAYKETCGYLQGDITYDELVTLIKQRSRNYAKRQLTWCRRYYPEAEILDYKNNLTNPSFIAKKYTEGKK